MDVCLQLTRTRVAILVGLAGLVGAAVAYSAIPDMVPSAQSPTRAQLPKMVLPDAVLKLAAGGLPGSFAFFATAEDAAASTYDPHDTGADLKRLGHVAGYVRGRNARGAFSPRAGGGLLAVGTSVILFRDASAARAAIERGIAEGKQFSGKALQEGVLVRYTARRARSLGSGAVLEHVRARPTGGTDRFQTNVTFRVGQLRGNVIVSRGDRTNADRLALDLAKQLQRRILTALRHG
jgi:hypothetical protein